MYKIIDKRSTGKTSQLLILAKSQGFTIVCSNPYALREKAYAYGITGINFLSYEDSLKEGRKPTEVLVDNLECYAAYILHKNNLALKGFSLTNEN